MLTSLTETLKMSEEKKCNTEPQLHRTQALESMESREDLQKEFSNKNKEKKDKFESKLEKEKKEWKNEIEIEKERQCDDVIISRSCLHKGIVFEKSYEECELINLPHYPVAIPAGLEGFKRKLLDCDGLLLEGVFRLRGKDISIRNSKHMLNNGSKISELKCTPIELAQILKTWFREVLCDEPGFLSFKLLEARSEEDILNAFCELTEPRRSILLWVFDLWIEVEKYCFKNKMTLKSMSIVFSPNLIRANDDNNPMLFLQYQKEAQRVLETAARLRQHGKLHFDDAGAIEPLFNKNKPKPSIPVKRVIVITSNPSETNRSGIPKILKHGCSIL